LEQVFKYYLNKRGWDEIREENRREQKGEKKRKGKREEEKIG
jgi:hypothetical protein